MPQSNCPLRNLVHSYGLSGLLKLRMKWPPQTRRLLAVDSNLSILKLFLFVCIASGIFCQCRASNVITKTVARNLNPRAEEWFGLNHPIIYYDPSNYASMAAKIKEIPYTSFVRVPIHWALLEPTRDALDPTYLGRLDSALTDFNAQSIRTVFFFVGSPNWITSDLAHVSDTYPPLDNQPYVDRAVWLAKRYGPRGLYGIQVWNEVNLPAFWNPAEDPAAYLSLYQATCSAIYGNSSTVLCLHAGMAYFSQMPNHGGSLYINDLFGRGGYANASMVSYHPYFHRPEGDDGDNDPEDFLVHSTFLNGNIHQFTSAKVWAGETGWSTYNTSLSEQPFITEDEQADYIIKRLALLCVADFDKIFLFAFMDFPDGLTGSARDEKYGIIDVNGREKPAFKSIVYFFSSFFTGEIRPLAPFKIDNSTITTSDVFYSVSMTVDAETTKPRHIALIWSPTGYSTAEIQVTCSAAVGINADNQFSAQVYDPVARSHLTTVPILSTGSFNLRLGSSARIVVIEPAAADNNTNNASPQINAVPVGTASPLSWNRSCWIAAITCFILYILQN